jgi:hypothetical protein
MKLGSVGLATSCAVSGAEVYQLRLNLTVGQTYSCGHNALTYVYFHD